MITLTGNSLTIKEVERVLFGYEEICLDETSLKKVDASRQVVEKIGPTKGRSFCWLFLLSIDFYNNSKLVETIDRESSITKQQFNSLISVERVISAGIYATNK